MKKEAATISNKGFGTTKGQTSYHVSSKKENDDEDMPEGEDRFLSKDDEDDFVEPKGPGKSDLKNNIIFIDDDDDFDDEF